MSRVWGYIKQPFTWFCSLIRFIFGRAESFHYLALTIAILVGGGWTVYTFDVLRMKDNAVQDLNKAENDLAKVKLELKDLQEKIDGTDSSYIEIKSHHFDYKDSKFGLIINVLVQNTGTNDVDMSWESSPLRIYKVETKDGDKQKITKPLIPLIYDKIENDKEKTYLSNLYLFVGAKKELSFFAEIDEPGLYYIIFSANTDGSVTKKLNELGKHGVWFSSKYIFIEGKNKTI